jgi:hypothetical protein
VAFARDIIAVNDNTKPPVLPLLNIMKISGKSITDLWTLKIMHLIYYNNKRVYLPNHPLLLRLKTPGTTGD